MLGRSPAHNQCYPNKDAQTKEDEAVRTNDALVDTAVFHIDYTTSASLSSPAPVDQSPRGTDELHTGDIVPAQTSEHDMHSYVRLDGVGGQPAQVELDEKAPLIEDPATRPVRKWKPKIRYPATEFDLNSVRTRNRRTVRRAN